MIEGILGETIERGHRLEGYSGGFHAPPYLLTRRPLALLSGATVLALLCCDPRLDPRKMLALDGTHSPIISMIRVPGGRASLAIKAIADCGMSHVTDEECREHLLKIAPEDEKESIKKENFGEIRGSFEDSIKEDIKVLRDSTWIKKNTRLIGLLYDTHTGHFKEVDDWNPKDWPGAADGKKTDAEFAADYAAALERIQAAK
ncbi:hypothetical protein F5884DRAFT_880047 [Xylogone sp. PMI_703]|nr:hypothetical protein F5884DRAFT_880047 [Xylogone sp. PMI_703]